jgi:hypothetical protein
MMNMVKKVFKMEVHQEDLEDLAISFLSLEEEDVNNQGPEKLNQSLLKLRLL